ncbi:MAG: zinc ribbon domain-containing protein [Acidimicrobiales bacterium]
MTSPCECSHVDKQSRVSQSMFVCTNCGYQANADLNAADEILKRGRKSGFAGGRQATAHQGTNLEPCTSEEVCEAEQRNCQGMEAGTKRREPAP